MSTGFKVGDLVDYHAVIDGPVTLACVRVRGGPFRIPPHKGRLYQLEGKPGVVCEEALTPATGGQL